MILALAWGVWHWRGDLADHLRSRLWWFVLLVLLTPPLTGFLGVRLPGETLPVPVIPVEVNAPAMMFFAALPWVLAAGLLGPLPAVILGMISGLILGNFETHSPFTPLELGGLALLFSIAIRQNYRTLFYRILRHPVGAALLVMVANLPVLILSSLLATNGTLAVRLDYAFTQTWLTGLARGGELLIASAIAELVYLFRPELWGVKRPLVPSPTETSLQSRFFFATLPLVILLVLTLIIGDWMVAGNAAQRMIEERLTSTAQVAADSLPYFFETGQNLILTLATPELLETSTADLPDMLAARLRSVPYYRQLYLFDNAGEFVSGYPENAAQERPTQEELMGIQLALRGVTTQTYVIRPESSETSAQVSFLAAIRDSSGEVSGVLLGRTDFNSNPFTQPAIKALGSMQELGGEGMILSESGLILYHPTSNQVMTPYLGSRPEVASFYDELSPNNTRQYVYFQPVVGRPWAVVLSVPAQLAQQIALDIAIPLLVMLLVFSVLAIVFLRVGLRAITSSLHVLSQEASHIALGQLDRPLPVKGVDEVGRMSAAFEQMRISLKARLEELNRLLYVSQGVAANLEIAESVRPILEAALVNGASSARVVLVRDVTLDTNDDRGPVAFGVGPASQIYASLDKQLFEMVRQQEMLNLPNVTRTRRMQIAPGQSAPGALLALAVRHENLYYGVLWVAYNRPRSFSEEEVRFLSTLSGEAALAATSARLYATAEVGRQRLEAVLASTPEPVLVSDERACLLLLNPAAVQVSGLILSPVEGRPIQEVVGSQEVIDMLTMPLTERISSREITLPNGRVYYGSVSSVLAESQPVGRVCILRDITHFKELEQMKSDFVATVSHDLRSPLTLMRGYATMLQMVGDLNDQQKGYVRKIVTGVENMTKLVNNLLDLGRIEAGIGLQIEKVSASDVVEEVGNSLQLQAVQKNINLTLEVNGQGKKLLIEADRALIQQAVYNLVENAIKYTPVGGQVKVRLEGRQNTVLMEVQDSGIGIAPLDLPHLFEKFYRSGRREAYQQRGTGLGLAIVRSIAERHGGRVWVDSQLGKGSVFSLEVPCEQMQKSSVEHAK